jgi:hypothetical protein
MAPRIDDLPDRALDVIASQVARWLPGLVGAGRARASASAITESFAVWGLSSDTVRRSATDDMRELAVWMKRWHHQIALNDQPALYARTAPGDDGPESWTVRELTESTLVVHLDRAIRWIDEFEKNRNWLVRLLIVPDYQLTGFWLIGEHGESAVLVAAAAPELRFQPSRLHPGPEFLGRLRQVEPVIGFVPSR